MLVLSRRVGERIMIGGDIVIEVVRFEQSDVKLGVTAPKNVPVHREEIHAIKKANGGQ